jgi:hypothetical protein
MLLAGVVPAKFVGLAKAIECARCKAQSADGQKFCGECGNPLDATIPALKDLASSALRDQVQAIIEQHYKDQKVVEIEITQAIANRLLDWAKLFAFFVGIPITVLLLILGVFGIKTYNDYASGPVLVRPRFKPNRLFRNLFRIGHVFFIQLCRQSKAQSSLLGFDQAAAIYRSKVDR